MSRKSCLAAFLLAAFGAVAPAGAFWAPQPLGLVERPLYVPGELILTFRAETSDAARQQVLAAHGLTVQRRLRVATGALLVRPPAGADVERVAADLGRRPEVRFADLNYHRYLEGIPNDTLFDQMWGMHNTGQTGGRVDADIDAPEAWELTVGSPNIVVAVLDSGLALEHQDLVDNLWFNPGEIPDNRVDDDGNGFIDDVNGWDFRDNDPVPQNSGGGCVGHGTHTAGTVGAVGNNGLGVTGVAQTVKIMPLRAFYTFLLILCTAQDADLLEAIDYMGLMGVPISNNSWGGAAGSNTMKDAIARSRHLFVVAAGNNGSNNDTNPTYPASYDLDNIVAVAATTDTDSLSFFSNFGRTSVDLAAPGSGILSTLPGGYGTLDGTSMASPHVAGAAVLLLAADPGATPRELKNRLLRGVDPLGLPVLTGGRLNVHRALTLPAAEVSVDVEPTGATNLPPGGTLRYDLTVTNHAGASRTVDVQVITWAPTGAEMTLAGPLSVTLAAGQSRTVGLTQPIPGGAPLGTYWLIGQATDGLANFDEDVFLFDVE